MKKNVLVTSVFANIFIVETVCSSTHVCMKSGGNIEFVKYSGCRNYILGAR